MGRENGSGLVLGGADVDALVDPATGMAAGSAVAARYLARREAPRLFIAGCGTQARSHVEAIGAVRHVEKVTLYDQDRGRATALASWVRSTGRSVAIAGEIHAARGSDII